MHRTVDIGLLAYLNCHMCILFVVVFVLVGRLVPIRDLLVLSVASSWLLLAITITTAYPMTSDGSAPR